MASPEQHLHDLARDRNPLGRTDPIHGIYGLDHRNNPKLIIPRLAAAIEEHTRFRAGPDGTLYRYENGVYLPDGEECVRLAAMAMLAGAYKPRTVNEVVQFYLDRERANPLDFDPDPAPVIRTASGVLDVRSWQTTAYDFENATTVQIPWNLVPGAACPQIDRFLLDCFEDDEEIVRFMFEVAGYVALTRNPLRLAFLMFGPSGNNGKSIFLYLLSHLLGRRNVAAVPLQRLGGDDRFSLARLVGRLANICGDIGPQTAKDMSLFKQLTGGDSIQAERKFREPFEFVSGATPVFSANEFPGSPDTTKAYKNRWVAVEWPREFEEDEHKENELKSLAENQAEMEGFLWKAALGAQSLIARGNFELPDEVRACTERFWRAVDSFESFADEMLVLDPAAITPAKTIWLTYEKFCHENGYKHVLGRNRFYEKLGGVQGVYRDMVTDKNHPFVGVKLIEYPAPEIAYAAEKVA